MAKTKRSVDNDFSYLPTHVQGLFHKAPCSGRVFYGANKSGKTRAGINESLWWASGLHPYRRVPVPSFGWIISQDFSQSRAALSGHKDADERFAEFTRWAANYMHLIKNINRPEKTVAFKNGSIIEWKSCASGDQKFQSTKIHWAMFDEVPLSREIFIEVTMRLMDYKGSWWMTATPTKGIGCWTYETIWEQRGKPLPQKNAIGNPIGYYNEELDTFLINPSIYDNKDILTGALNLDEKVVRYQEKTNTAAGRSIRLNGIPMAHEGLVFGECWRPERHIVDHFEIPASWPRYRGIDWGYSEYHPFVCVWLAQSPDAAWYLYEEYTNVRGAPNIWAQGIEARSRGQNIEVTVADPRGAERADVIGEHGIWVMKGKGDPEARYDLLAELLFTDKFFVVRHADGTPSAPTFVENMSRFSWQRMDSRRTSPSQRPRPLHNDSIDAAGYLLLERFPPPEKAIPIIKLSPQETEARAVWAAMEKQDAQQKERKELEAMYGSDYYLPETGGLQWIM